MTEKRRADLVGVGEEFEPHKFRVTPEFNRQYLEAVEDHHAWYVNSIDYGLPIVNPALLIAQSNITRSPSFFLPYGMALIHVKEEVEYLNPGRVGKSFTVLWKVIDMYEKRGRPYQVKETLIVDEDGVDILKRTITDTYIWGENS